MRENDVAHCDPRGVSTRYVQPRQMFTHPAVRWWPWPAMGLMTRGWNRDVRGELGIRRMRCRSMATRQSWEGSGQQGEGPSGVNKKSHKSRRRSVPRAMESQWHHAPLIHRLRGKTSLAKCHASFAPILDVRCPEALFPKVAARVKWNVRLVRVSWPGLRSSGKCRKEVC
jgi:hypothetical protein